MATKWCFNGISTGFGICLLSFLSAYAVTARAETVGKMSFISEHCHAMKKSSQVLPTGTASPNSYSEYFDIEKWDIFCAAEKLRISQPIRTNGGDVIIYAHELIVAAPIDTRVTRTAANPVYVELWPGASSDPRSRPEAANSNALVLAYHANSVTPEGQIQGDALFEMPPGESQLPLVDCETAVSPNRAMAQGARPPSWEPTHFRSGNIHIFANSVKIEPTAFVDLNTGDPLYCGPQDAHPIVNVDFACYDQNPKSETCIRQLTEYRNYYFHSQRTQRGTERKVFITQGVRGGRGGVGKIYQPWQGSRFGCAKQAYYTDGAFNGPGGKGSDAGSVFLSYISPLFEPSPWEQAVRQASAVDGGRPGSDRWLSAPMAIHLNSSVAQDVCSFKDFGQRYNEIYKGGSHGAVHTLQLDPTSALERLYLLLAMKDSDPRYVTSELVERGTTRASNVVAVSYIGFLERKFAEFLKAEQLRYLESFEAFINNKPIQATHGSRLLSFDLASPGLARAEQIRYLLAELQYFQPATNDDHSEVIDFFVQSGGVLNLDAPSRYRDLSELNASIDAVTQRLLTANIRTLLVEIAQHLSTIKGAMLRKEYRDHSAQLQAALDSLLQKSDDFGIYNDALVKIVSGAKNMVAGVASDNVGQFVKGATEVYGGHQELDGLLQISDNAQELISISIELVEIRRLSEQMEIDLSKDRAHYLAARMDGLTDEFDARLSLGVRSAKRLSLFKDMLKLSIISYYLDPSRDRIQLQQNLLALKNLVGGNGAAILGFALREPLSGCLGNVGEPRCFEFTPSMYDSRYYIVVRTPVSRLLGLPLLVVDRSSGNTIVDSYGSFDRISKVKIISLDY